MGLGAVCWKSRDEVGRKGVESERDAAERDEMDRDEEARRERLELEAAEMVEVVAARVSERVAVEAIMIFFVHSDVTL